MAGQIELTASLRVSCLMALVTPLTQSPQVMVGRVSSSMRCPCEVSARMVDLATEVGQTNVGQALLTENWCWVLRIGRLDIPMM